ncbi:MAG: hypothetical protein Q7T15_05125 [Microcella sp.]|uniref:hypothetical protein n=1 Tax=Microcella sp. TaxID=1913979 RepID=UPI0027270BEE|nr:hypothetical protein [Microcella sp.]MDO8337619.1 hypothetical protein [Microcella sp.]
MPPGDVDALLAGPRGRRLCLEVAAGLDSDVGQLVLWSSMGMSRPAESWTFGWAVKDSSSPERSVAPWDVARAIEAVALRAADEVGNDEGLLREALIASVDSALYWQEPDAEDQLAAVPEVRAALRPIAAAIVATDEAHSWAAPWASRGWMTIWGDDLSLAPLTSGAASVARWDAEQEADEERARRERPDDVTANWSGTWWSLPQSARSWREPEDAMALVEDAVAPMAATLVEVVGEGRVREIGSAEDWAELCREHPLDVTASRRHDWYRVTGRDGRWVIPDLRAVSAQWDALHLTTFGYLSAATTTIPVDDERASVIAGWAPDCTQWLADRFHETGMRQGARNC